MLYTTWTVGDQEYHLRITTKSVVDLEGKLGKNPLEIFMAASQGKLPMMTEYAAAFHAALQPLQHGITEAKVYDILDAYFEEGHNQLDLIPTLLEVFQSSGLIGKETGESEKN